MVEAYPLQYPVGWERTKNPQKARFGTTFGKARDGLMKEIRLLGGRFPVITSNLPLKRNGLPYATYKEPEDAGVAVYFELYGQQQCIPCDRWNKIADNMQAIRLTISALRGIGRWGAENMVKASFQGFKALPEHIEMETTQYFTDCATQEELKAKRKKLAGGRP